MVHYAITQIKSTIGEQEKIKATLKALGLKKIGSKSILKKMPATDGLVAKVSHLIKYEIVENAK